MLRVLWEYEVAVENRPEFETAYGPAGPWVALFSGAPGYLGTELLRDPGVDGRYVTIDSWRSRGDLEWFTAGAAERYAEIDAACERLTRAERALGAFESV